MTFFFFFFGGIQGIYVVWLGLLQWFAKVQFGGTPIPHMADVQKAGMIQRSQAKCLKFEGDGVNTIWACALNLIFW